MSLSLQQGTCFQVTSFSVTHVSGEPGPEEAGGCGRF